MTRCVSICAANWSNARARHRSFQCDSILHPIQRADVNLSSEKELYSKGKKRGERERERREEKSAEFIVHPSKWWQQLQALSTTEEGGGDWKRFRMRKRREEKRCVWPVYFVSSTYIGTPVSCAFFIYKYIYLYGEEPRFNGRLLLPATSTGQRELQDSEFEIASLFRPVFPLPLFFFLFCFVSSSRSERSDVTHWWLSVVIDTSIWLVHLNAFPDSLSRKSHSASPGTLGTSRMDWFVAVNQTALFLGFWPTAVHKSLLNRERERLVRRVYSNRSELFKRRDDRWPPSLPPSLCSVLAARKESTAAVQLKCVAVVLSVDLWTTCQRRHWVLMSWVNCGRRFRVVLRRWWRQVWR